MLFRNKNTLFCRLILSLSLLSLAQTFLFASDSEQSATGSKKRKISATPDEEAPKSPPKRTNTSNESQSTTLTPGAKALAIEGSLSEKLEIDEQTPDTLTSIPTSPKSPKSPKSPRQGKSAALLNRCNIFLMASLFSYNGSFISFSKLGLENISGKGMFESLMNSMCSDAFFSPVCRSSNTSSSSCDSSSSSECDPELTLKINRIKFFKACCDCVDKAEIPTQILNRSKEAALGYEEKLLFQNQINLLNLSPFRSFSPPVGLTASSPISSFSGRTSTDSDKSSADQKSLKPPFFEYFLPLISSYYLYKAHNKEVAIPEKARFFMSKFNQKFLSGGDCSTSLFLPSEMIASSLISFDQKNLNLGGFESHDHFFSCMKDYFETPGFIFEFNSQKILKDGLFIKIMQQSLGFQQETKAIRSSMEVINKKEKSQGRNVEKKNEAKRIESNLVLLKKITEEISGKESLNHEDFEKYVTQIASLGQFLLQGEVEPNLKGALYELSVAPKIELLLSERIIYLGEKIGEPPLDYDLCTTSFCIEAKNKVYRNLLDMNKDIKDFINHKKNLEVPSKNSKTVKRKMNLESPVKRNYFVVFGGKLPSDNSHVGALEAAGIPWIHLPTDQNFKDFKAALQKRKIAMSDNFSDFIAPRAQPQVTQLDDTRLPFSSILAMNEEAFPQKPQPVSLEDAEMLEAAMMQNLEGNSASASAAP